jgi:hypothetical protein
MENEKFIWAESIWQLLVHAPNERAIEKRDYWHHQ